MMCVFGDGVPELPIWYAVLTLFYTLIFIYIDILIEQRKKITNRNIFRH